MFQILAESHSSTSIYLETKQNTHRKTILGETKNTRQKNYVYKQKKTDKFTSSAIDIFVLLSKFFFVQF